MKNHEDQSINWPCSFERCGPIRHAAGESSVCIQFCLPLDRCSDFSFEKRETQFDILTYLDSPFLKISSYLILILVTWFDSFLKSNPHVFSTDPSRPTQRTFAPRRDRAVWLRNWAAGAIKTNNRSTRFEYERRKNMMEIGYIYILIYTYMIIYVCCKNLPRGSLKYQLAYLDICMLKCSCRMCIYIYIM